MVINPILVCLMAYTEFENRSISLVFVLFLKINDFILNYILTALDSKAVRSLLN